MLKVVLAFLLLIVPAQAAPVTDASQWIVTHRGAYTYLMPPKQCRIGPVPSYSIIHVPQTDLDAALPRKLRAKGIHLYAIHDIGIDGVLIYISNALPHRPAVYQDIIQHELAHLRGCEHGEQAWKAVLGH